MLEVEPQFKNQHSLRKALKIRLQLTKSGTHPEVRTNKPTPNLSLARVSSMITTREKLAAL